MPTPPTATGPGRRAPEQQRTSSRRSRRSGQPRGGAPGGSGGESGPQGREARAQPPDGAAGSLELVRVRLPTSALGRPRPAEVRAPPALEREGDGRPKPRPGPFYARESQHPELRVRARRPEVNWPGGWRRRKHQLAFSALGETCRGRVRPSLNSHPSAWVSLSGTRWRRPHRC